MALNTAYTPPPPLRETALKHPGEEQWLELSIVGTSSSANRRFDAPCEYTALVFVRTTVGVASATFETMELVFFSVVGHEDHGLFVIWDWGWCFRDTDCCPTTHFHPFLCFGGEGQGID